MTSFLLFYYMLYFGNLSMLMNQDLLPYCNFCTVFHCVDLSLSSLLDILGGFQFFTLYAFLFFMNIYRYYPEGKSRSQRVPTIKFWLILMTFPEGSTNLHSLESSCGQSCKLISPSKKFSLSDIIHVHVFLPKINILTTVLHVCNDLLFP